MKIYPMAFATIYADPPWKESGGAKMEKFRARQRFRELERLQAGANDSQCWHQMSSGLPCLKPGNHGGRHGL